MEKRNNPKQKESPVARGGKGGAHRSEEWLLSEPRRGARASISSKKRTQGCAARARANSCRTARSLSPTYLFSSSGPLMEMKLAPDSLAAALATSVLPHPGGPNSSTPDADDSPSAAKASGLRIGCVIANVSSSRICTAIVCHSGRDPLSRAPTALVSVPIEQRELQHGIHVCRARLGWNPGVGTILDLRYCPLVCERQVVTSACAQTGALPSSTRPAATRRARMGGVDLVQGANVVPRRVGARAEPLAPHAGLHLGHGGVEVGHRDREAAQLSLIHI